MGDLELSGDGFARCERWKSSGSRGHSEGHCHPFACAPASYIQNSTGLRADDHIREVHVRAKETAHVTMQW